MSNKLMSLALAAIFVIALTPPAARAADPQFCAQYAQAAQNQVRGALAQPRCAPSISGARWSPDYQYHYNWCGGVSREAAEFERGFRTGFIDSCKR
jgi:hypothetical protein